MLVHLYSAILTRTFDLDLAIVDAVFDVLVEALEVVDMGAVQNYDFLWLH